MRRCGIMAHLDERTELEGVMDLSKSLGLDKFKGLEKHALADAAAVEKEGGSGGHRYIKREETGDPKRPYRYIYQNSEGKTFAEYAEAGSVQHVGGELHEKGVKPDSSKKENNWEEHVWNTPPQMRHSNMGPWVATQTVKRVDPKGQHNWSERGFSISLNDPGFNPEEKKSHWESIKGAFRTHGDQILQHHQEGRGE